MDDTGLIYEEDKICIIVPTFRRPKGLRAVLESVFLQDGMKQNIDVLVVDNNPIPVEKALVEEISAQFNHEIIYVHEPSPGVSNARNAAMNAIGDCRYIGFVDDDMVVSPEWLSSLLKTLKTYNAGLVFGPTYAVMPDENNPNNTYMAPFFERTIHQHEDGLIEETLGTGGCLLDLKFCQLPTPAFNPDLNERGGEDDIFFDHLKLSGTKVA